MKLARFALLSVTFVLALFLNSSAADVSYKQLRSLVQTIQQLKMQVQELERRLKAYEERQRKMEADLEKTRKLKKEAEEKAKIVESLKEVLGNTRISADITMVGQGTINNDNNNNRKHDEGDVQDGAWSFDLEIEGKLWKNARAYMLIEGGQGDSVDDEVPTISGFNDDAPGTDTAHAEITEAWFEQEVSVGPGIFTFTVGKVDLTNYFDTNEVANDETEQFLSSGFVNNLAVEWPDDNGPGIRFTYDLGKWYIGVGFASADGDWEDLFDGVFGIAEVGMQINISGLVGHYRIYGWFNTRSHLDVDDIKHFIEGKHVNNDEDNYGMGVSFDQEIVKDILVAFLRAGWENQDVVLGDYSCRGLSLDSVPIKGSLSFGFRLSGRLWGREDDELGTAYGVVFVNDDAQKVYKEYFYSDYYIHPENVDMEDEHHVEVYYKASFFDGHLEFTPDLQFVINPNGNGDADTVYILGTRMQVNF